MVKSEPRNALAYLSALTGLSKLTLNQSFPVEWAGIIYFLG